MTQKITLSDLLAYRDGDPVSGDVQAELDQNPALAAQLQQTIELRDELKAMPDEVPSPELWQQVQAAAAQHFETQIAPAVPKPATPASVSWFASPHLRLATAASVFLVGVLASALWLRHLPESATGAGERQMALEAPVLGSGSNGSGSETLLDRSRRLEEAVQSQVVSAGAQPSRAQRALMFRIADLDAELNSLQQEAMHPELKERLWRQRVELLETLMEIQRFQMHSQAEF